ncbi:MAG: insulinase family protein [Ilumatobacteraceae bacterium]
MATGWVGVGARRVRRVERREPLPRAPAVQGHAGTQRDRHLAHHRPLRRRHQRLHHQGVHGLLLPAPGGAIATIGIELLGDVLTSPSLRTSDVDTERQVILEEIAWTTTVPTTSSSGCSASRCSSITLGRDTAGSPVDDLDDERRRRALLPSVTTPPIDGGVDRRAVRTRRDARRGEHRVRRGASRRRSGGGCPVATGTSTSVDDDTEQVHLVVGGLGVDRHDPDREALDVVNHVLGGGLSSRLFDELRERRGLVYSVYSGLACYADTGTWSISTSSQPHHADEVAALIGAELARLVEGGVTDDELAIATGYLTGSYELGLEDSGSRMMRNGGLLCTRGEIAPIGDQVARWEAVDRATVERVIDRVLRTEPIVVRLGPG